MNVGFFFFFFHLRLYHIRNLLRVSLLQSYRPGNRVVRNHSLNIIRELAKSTISSLEIHNHAEGADDSTTRQLDYNDANRLLNEALDNLPPQQRQVCKLCHLEGMKYDAVAEHMQISPRTVSGTVLLAK